MKLFLNQIIIPIIIAIEVIGVYKLYPLCENSIWKLFLLYIGLYITYELYKEIKNYCRTIF